MLYLNGRMLIERGNELVKKIINILIGLDTVLIILFVGIFAYNKNAFNIKQTVGEHHRQEMVKNVKISTQEITQIQAQSSNVKVGTIAIPELGILLPIDNQPYSAVALRQGAQQVETNDNHWDTLGKGNFVVVGHNFANGYQYFSALQQYANDNYPYLQNGRLANNRWLNDQHIYVACRDQIFDFEIDNQKTIAKDDYQVLQNSDYPEINLITCLEPNDNYRIVTHGTLINTWNWNNAPKKVVSYFDLKYHHYNIEKG